MTKRLSVFNKKGFGLMETLIAGGIIAIVASSAFALNSSVIKKTVVLSDRTTASWLASEQLEAVRQIRDSNLIDGQPSTLWSEGVASLVGQVAHADCSAVPSNDPAPTVVSVGKCQLKTGTLTDCPIPGTTCSTQFTRKITVTPVTGDPNAYHVRVDVSWQFEGVTKTLTVSEVLTDWRVNS